MEQEKTKNSHAVVSKARQINWWKVATFVVVGCVLAAALVAPSAYVYANRQVIYWATVSHPTEAKKAMSLTEQQATNFLQAPQEAPKGEGEQ